MNNWITQPISRHCEVFDEIRQRHCGKPTEYCYKAMNRGWMALCDRHAVKHLDYAEPIQTLLAKGESYQSA